MYAIGIDIGTTSICALAFDCKTGKAIKTITERNAGIIEDTEKSAVTCNSTSTEGIDAGNSAPALATTRDFEDIQSPEAILSQVSRMARELSTKFNPVAAIGISCQMHGIVYTDCLGNAVSPLYTWQDGRGSLTAPGGGVSYAGELSQITGNGGLASGYGAVTHYYNLKNNLVSEKATGFCAIGDYVGNRLAGNHANVTHASNAASFGLYDVEMGRFDGLALQKAGMSTDFFPKAIRECSILGVTKENVPVSVCIGDNQASFIGSAANPDDTILVNIGTGGQVSASSGSATAHQKLESRPLTPNRYLHVGSTLCGGRAYAALERFFSLTLRMAGFDSGRPLYEDMDRLLESDRGGFNDRLNISTLFEGARSSPDLRGSVNNLGLGNFTPEHFIDGVLRGIADELYELSGYIDGIEKRGTLVCSGNGVRKNRHLRKRIEERFNRPALIPEHEEEAAFGAALFALTACGHYGSLPEAQSVISFI